MNKYVNIINYLVVLFLAIATATAGAQQQPVASLQGQLSQVEADDLVFMREEEKLARDTYLFLAGQWDLVVFPNIAESEQRHMDALELLLDAFGIDDPVVDETDIGTFTDASLQALFNDLTAAGMQSEIDALMAGGTIEETDILDLQETIGHSENADVIAVYENLLCGSRNHLRAFVRQVELYGEVYEPVLMSEEELSAIVDFPTERGCGTNKQGGNGAGNGAGNSVGNGSGTGNGLGNGNGAGNGTGNGSCDGTGTGVPGDNCIGG